MFGRPRQSQNVDERIHEIIPDHLEKLFGKSASVSHPTFPIFGEPFHLDIYIYPPDKTQNRNYILFITCGMSSLPMYVSGGVRVPRYVELVAKLAPEEMNCENIPIFESDPNSFQHWVNMSMRQIATIPSMQYTYLGDTHSIDDTWIQQASRNRFYGYVLVNPNRMNWNLPACRIDSQKDVHFLQLIPVTKKEMDLILKETAARLFERGFLNKRSDILSSK